MGDSRDDNVLGGVSRYRPLPCRTRDDLESLRDGLGDSPPPGFLRYHAKELLTRSFILDPAFDPGGDLLPTAGILAKAYLKEGDWVSADDVLSKLIQKGETNSIWYYLDAFALIKLQKFSDARLVVLDGLKRDEQNQFLKSLFQYLSRPVNELLGEDIEPLDDSLLDSEETG